MHSCPAGSWLAFLLRRQSPLQTVSALVCLLFIVALRDVSLVGTGDFVRALRFPRFAEPRDAQLDVTLLDELGHPVSAASVRVFASRGDDALFAGDQNADGAGLVRFRTLPRGKVWVLAYGEGRARVSGTVVLLGGMNALRLAMPRARALSVVVVDDSDHGVEGASVEVTTTDPLPFAATTTKDGAARMDRLGAPPYAVRVSASGYETVTRDGVVPGPSSTKIRLERPATVIAHVRTPTGEAAPGVSVLAVGTGLWPPRSTETDNVGEARISGLAGGMYALKARGGNTVSRTEVAISVARGERRDVNLLLEPGRRLHVAVADAEVQPAACLAGASVVVAEEGLSSFPVSTRTDGNGIAELGPIAREPATVYAAARDYIPRAVFVNATTTDVRVALWKGGSLVGDVFDDRGYPVGGATIEVIGIDPDGMPVDDASPLFDFRGASFERLLSGPVPLLPVGEARRHARTHPQRSSRD